MSATTPEPLEDLGILSVGGVCMYVWDVGGTTILRDLCWPKGQIEFSDWLASLNV